MIVLVLVLTSVTLPDCVISRNSQGFTRSLCSGRPSGVGVRSRVNAATAAMVFEGILVDILNRFLGPYVKNLDASQLRVGIWGGGQKMEQSAAVFLLVPLVEFE